MHESDESNDRLHLQTLNIIQSQLLDCQHVAAGVTQDQSQEVIRGDQVQA